MRPLQNKMLVFSLACVVSLGGCATVPKPVGLAAFERLEQRGQAGGALAGLEPTDRHLLVDSKRAKERAIEAWEDGDVKRSEHHAALAQTYWRQALARAALARARSKLREVQRQNAGLAAQNNESRRHLSRVNELIALHEELAMARINTREKAMHLSEVQKQATARHRITKARLALKVAETVEGQRLAKTQHAAAAKLIAKAKALLAAKQPTKAAALASAAERKAQEAYTKAKPLFLRDKRAAELGAKNLALQRAIAAWAAKQRGVTVRVGVGASGPQLELRVMRLFAANKTTPTRKKRAVVDKLGQILKRYPGYPVLIRGFTSFVTKRRRRGGVSRARAATVREQLVAAGSKASRFVAEGAGASKLIAGKMSGLNDRVELLIPLAADKLDSRKPGASSKHGEASKPTLTEVRDVGPAKTR
jgi:outer membrane protein OmpA-like peptidoglycan-associated protein